MIASPWPPPPHSAAALCGGGGQGDAIIVRSL